MDSSKLPERGLSVFVICLLLSLLSCGDQYYKEEDFLLVKKIDSHVHLNSESTALIKQAQNDNFFLLAVNVDAPSYPSLEEQSRIANSHIEKAPGVVAYLTSFSIAEWDSASWTEKTLAKLESDFAKGALGVKLWKNIGMVSKDSAGNFVMIDNQQFDPVIDFIIRNDKTILGHLGDPRNCWLPLEEMTVNNDKTYFKQHPEYHMYLHPDVPSYEEQVDARVRFLEKHSNLRYVGAHLGSLEWSVDELAEHLDRFENMAVDMAARIVHLQHQSITDYEKVRNFIIKYQDRLIYATDSGISPESDPEQVKKQVHQTWMNDWKFFVTNQAMQADGVNGKFKGLKLPKSVIDKIYRENAVTWFKLKE